MAHHPTNVAERRALLACATHTHTFLFDSNVNADHRCSAAVERGSRIQSRWLCEGRARWSFSAPRLLRPTRQLTPLAFICVLAESRGMSDGKENRQPGLATPTPAPAELAHRSALTLRHAQSHVERLERELRDAQREAQVSRAAEIVVADQLARTQTQLAAQSQRALQLQREHSDMQLRLQHATQQSALILEHAKEQSLLAELADKQWRSRYAAKEKQLLDELAARQRDIDELKRTAAEQIRAELDNLRTHASHDTIVAMHEQKTRMEEAAAESERNWRQRCEQLEAELRAHEAAHLDEMRQQHSAAQTERDNLIRSHQSQLAALQREHAASLDDSQRHSATEAAEMQQRIHQLIHAQQQTEADNSRLREQQAAQQQSAITDHAQRVQELDAHAQSLSAHSTLLQTQLESVDAKLREAQDHNGHLTAQYNDLLTQFQSLACQAQNSASAVQIVTAERDACKSKYVALGSRLEQLLSADESSLASTLDNERRKRDAVKSAYAAERAKWKEEKHTLQCALSDQEKELGELRSLTRECQSKLADAHSSLQELRAIQATERHAAELHIAQLQQDAHACQAQKKISDDEIREKNHQIEKLLVEKTHVEGQHRPTRNDARLLCCALLIPRLCVSVVRLPDRRHAPTEPGQRFVHCTARARIHAQEQATRIRHGSAPQGAHAGAAQATDGRGGGEGRSMDAGANADGRQGGDDAQ